MSSSQLIGMRKAAEAGDAREVAGSIVSERRAPALALEHTGALAFSRTGDPATDEFQDAVILARFGEVDLDSLGE